MVVMSGASASKFSPSPAALRNERDRFVALAFSWADLLFELDAEARITFAAGALGTYVGCGEKQLLGRPFLDLVAPDDRNAVRSLLLRAERRERTEDVLVRLDGERRDTPPLAISGYQLPELGGHFFIALRNRQVASRGPDGVQRRTQPGEETLRTSDAFVASLSRHLGRGEADGSALSLIVLPGYEELRQRLEETAELKLVANLGACLRKHSLAGAMAGRLGADRYGLMHAPDLDLPQLRQDIAALTREADPLHRGVAVRATTLAIDGEPPPEAALSRVIGYAVNQLERTDDEGDLPGSISQLAQQALAAADQLRRLLASDSLVMMLQPIVDTTTCVPHHYEALVRFPANSPLGDLGQHISFAEFTGMIVDLDLAMARKAIDWLRRETGPQSRVSIAVNVSGHSINSMTYLANLDRLLNENRWLDGRLLFEITESARIDDLAAANAFVQRLRHQGAKVCLDDFGAGAANFQYLSGLEVDIVKLDGYAFRDALKARKGKAFLRAFVGLCRELGIATVAEMIETPALYAVAQECGVDYVQGFLFGRPSADLRSAASPVIPMPVARRRSARS